MTIRRLHRRLWVDVLQLFWVAGWRRERIAKWEPNPRSSNGGKPNPGSYSVRSGGIFAILFHYAMLRSCWAIDSKGATIDFLLSALRDADAAKRLFRKALGDRSHPQPRVINTDLAPTYSSAIPDTKKEGTPRSSNE